MKRPLKLITVGHSYVVELNRRLAHEMSLQSDGGWEVTAIAPRYFHGSRDLRPVTAQAGDGEPIRLEIVPAHLTRYVHGFFYGRRLAELLTEGDLVHCWEEPFVAAGAQVAWCTPRKTPLVVATFQNLPKRYPPPFSQFERYTMRRASGWIAFAQSVVEVLGTRPLYARRPMRQIPPGVDLNAFHPDPEAGARTRRSLCWEGDGPPVVGYLGRFLPEKGIDDLMQALDAIHSPWRALFVGAGPLETQLRRWGKRHGDRVRVCTDVGHAMVPEYLNAMDMLAAPSRTTPRWREQFGRMLIEAFACGLPVLGSSSGEIPHVIGDAGCVVPEGDFNAWANAIGSLVDSPQKRSEWSARGLARAHEHFAWPVVAKKHLDFFHELIEARAPQAPSPASTMRPPETTSMPAVRQLSSGAPPPRRLLSIAHSYAVGVNRRLAHEMSKAGTGVWDVTAVAPRYFHGSGDLRPVTFASTGSEPCRVEVVPAHLTRYVHLFRYGTALKSILREPWDLIHVWEEPYIYVGYQIARWAPPGVPLVYRTAQSLTKRYPPPFNWIEAHNMTRASGWICSGTLVAETLGAREIYQRRPVRLIPLGVDLDFYQRTEAGLEQTLTELGWDRKGPPVMGYMGRFVTAKGLRLLSEVLDELHTPWRALFIGAGPMEGYLRRWGERYGGRVQVCTKVQHNDVPRYLSVMDIMCAPSQTTRNWREQFGRMLIEAFAAGVAVVGSDSGEIPHVIADAGVVCGENDHHAWVRQLRSLLGSPGLRAEFAERGLERARQYFAWPVVARQYLEFFDELATSGAKTPSVL
jgi:phosphatidylinositol alpha-1,6-mannosyltransferase